MKNLIYINACMRASSRTQRIATPIIEELRKRYKVETVDLTKNLYQATPYIKALSHLWNIMAEKMAPVLGGRKENHLFL